VVSWFFCKHQWIEVGRAKLSAIRMTEMHGYGSTLEEMIEKLDDRTSILLKCSHCGDMKESVVSGWFPQSPNVERSEAIQDGKPPEAKP